MALQLVTLAQIKAHIKVEDNTQDDELTLFGEAIEQEAFNFMERSYDSLIVEFGTVPADIKLACLAHLASAYKTREDQQDRKKGMAATKMPYAWEAKLIKYKPGNKI